MASRKNSLLSLEIRGAKELEAAMRDLGSDRLIKATNRRALLKAAQPVAKDAQRRARRGEGGGRMWRKIAASSTLSRRQRRSGAYRRSPNVARVFIGAGPRGPGLLVEFGSGPRYQRKTGKFVGVMPAFPFMRPAWEAGKHKVLEDYSRELWIDIEKTAKRLARRQARQAGIRL